MKTTIRTGHGLEQGESRSSDPQIFPATNDGEFVPGSLRYDYQSREGRICVYTGYSWTPLPETSYTIDLSFESKKILEWAKLKMAREEKLKKLCETNPTVAKAYKKYQQAEEHVELLTILSEHA